METLQLENPEFDLEVELVKLKALLETTFAEKAEIIENGFSFASSLKDISRYIITNLIEQLNKDVPATLYIVQNWQRYVEALDNPELLEDNDFDLHMIFTNVYYSSIDYFRKQFLSHLGEKVELSAELVQDPKVRRFIETTGFRQRKFQYFLENSDIQFVNASAFRTYDIKKSEREKVELLNSIFLRFISNSAEASTLLQATVSKYPELEDELFQIYSQTQSIHLTQGQKLIEMSPPFEEYSYQHDCMFRVYTCTENGFTVDQYSLPYNPEEMDIVIQNLLLSFNASGLVTSSSNEYLTNNVLGRFFITNIGTPSAYVNSFPSILEYGGSEVIETANGILVPQINTVADMVHPLIVQYINSPNFTNVDGESRFDTLAAKYKEVFLSAVATLDTNIKNENPEVATALASGEVLRAAVNGTSISEVLQQASNGSVSSIAIESDGYCDTVTGTLGSTSEPSREVYSATEVSQLEFKGKVMTLTKGKDTPLELKKFIDKNGNELKLFVCPVCKAGGTINYVDICAKQCPECSVSLEQMRLEAEKENLDNFVSELTSSSQDSYTKSSKNNEGSNGVFSILFDLFGAVFNMF